MQVEFINPFLKSIVKTFETMLGCTIKRGDLRLKNDLCSKGPISGVIGLTGKVAGTVVLNLSEEAAKKAASAMLMTEVTELDADVLDAIGELTNMVAGSAKAELQQHDLNISLPNVVTGEGHIIRFPSNVTPICVPFETSIGPIELEVGFATTS